MTTKTISVTKVKALMAYADSQRMHRFQLGTYYCETGVEWINSLPSDIKLEAALSGIGFTDYFFWTLVCVSDYFPIYSTHLGRCATPEKLVLHWDEIVAALDYLYTLVGVESGN